MERDVIGIIQACRNRDVQPDEMNPNGSFKYHCTGADLPVFGEVGGVDPATRRQGLGYAFSCGSVTFLKKSLYYSPPDVHMRMRMKVFSMWYRTRVCPSTPVTDLIGATLWVSEPTRSKAMCCWYVLRPKAAATLPAISLTALGGMMSSGRCRESRIAQVPIR